MKKRSLKSANDQIHRISENYPNHRWIQVATQFYFNRIDRIVRAIGITEHTEALTCGTHRWYDREEFYSNWNTEVSMEAR